MLRLLTGLVIVLHGLVHLWYVALARRLVDFKPEMGWSGRSWLFTNLIGDRSTRTLASILMLVAAVGLAVGGIGFMAQQPWTRRILVASAAYSAILFGLFWDGDMQYLAGKGLIGLLIDLAILAGLLVWG